MPTPTAQIPPDPTSATRRTALRLGLPLLALTLLIGVSSVFTFRHLRDSIQQETQRTLTVIAEQKRQQIETLVAQNRIDAETYFYGRSLVVILFSQWLDGGRQDRALLEQLQSRLEILARARGWQGVAVFDAEARPVLSFGETAQEHQTQIQDVLRQPRTEWLDIHRHGQEPEAYSILTPLGLPGSAPLGAVLLTWRADQTLYPLVQTWPVPTRTAETFLIRRDGDQVCTLTPLRFQPEAVLRLCRPVTADLPAARAARGERGFLADARDYRGVPVLAYSTALAGTPWWMIAKIDQDEAYADIRAMALVTTFVTGLVVLLLYVAGYALWRRDRQRRALAALQREQALQAQQLHTLQLLNAIANGATDAIFAKDTQGCYLFLNRVAAATTGKAAEDILGRDDTALFPPDQAAQIMAHDQQVMAENRTVTSQNTITTVHGERTMLAIKGPLHDASGRVIGLFGISRDITELKAVEDALRRAKDFADQLIDFANVMVLGLAPDGRILIFNAKAEEITGYSRQELLGQDWFATVVPRERDAVTPAAFAEAMATGEPPRELENTIWTRAGEPRRIAWWNSLLVHPDGERISVSLGVDVTAQRAAERELADYRQDLERHVAERTTDLAAEVTERRRAEAQLRQSEETAQRRLLEIEAYYDTAPVGLFVVDAELRFLRINERLAEINGSPIAAHLGRSIREVIPDLADALEPLYRRVLDTGESLLNLEIAGETRARPGVPQIFRASYYPLKDLAGQVIGINGMVEDITEPKRIEQEIRELNAHLERRVEERTAQVRAASATLRESEERFRLAFNQANSGMCLVDLQGKILQVNDKMSAIFGYSRQELEGMTVNDLAVPDDRTLSLVFIAHATHGDGDSALFEKRYRHRLGHLVYGEVASSLVRDAQGQPRYFISQLQDITARKQAEQALEHSLAELERAQAIAQMGSWSLDLVNHRMEWSKEVYVISGIEPGAPIKPQTHFQLIHPDDLAAFEAAWQATLEGAPYDITHRIIVHGQVKWVHARAEITRDHDGHPYSVLGTLQDITERKRYEQELQQARKAAEAADRAKSEFLAHMSHEIRTPLNGVLGLAQVLGRAPLTADQRDMVERIQSAGQSLLVILNDLLDLSKIEAGQLRLEHRPFNLGTVLAKLTHLLGQSAQAKGLEWRIAAPVEPPEWLLGDALRLEQVLVNLAGNALKFTERGEVTIQVAVRETGESAVRLRCEVRDTGIGIAPEVQARLFTPFTQADSGISRQFGGTGLGLAICKRLVELMGGVIGVESQVGQGSTFWFELPLARTTAGEAEISPAPTPAPPAGPRLAGVRVLVVDDSVLNRNVAERALQLEGATVTLAADGQQAVEYLKARPDGFDAVLMDIQMPVMDGLTATRLIRSDLGLTALPIFALTAAVLPKQQQAALVAGVQAVLAKPLDLKHLVAEVRKWLPSPRPLAGEEAEVRAADSATAPYPSPPPAG